MKNIPQKPVLNLFFWAFLWYFSSTVCANDDDARFIRKENSDNPEYNLDFRANNDAENLNEKAANEKDNQNNDKSPFFIIVKIQ